MQVHRPISFGIPSAGRSTADPRFGMTPEQRKEAREKIFDTLYPQLDGALDVLALDHSRQSKGTPNIWTLSSQTIVKVMAQLACFQEPPQPPRL